MSKNAILKGTLILTIAGFLTRFIGFFYRIFLSNYLGAEKMGIYQLVFPIYGICATLYSSGIQTAISSLVASNSGNLKKTLQQKVLKIGLFFSIIIALILSILLFINADIIASIVLIEPRCASSLRVLSLVFPFCGATSCINGYYYGLKKAFVPASSQLIEQIIRVISVYFIAVYLGHGDLLITCELAVFGVVLGEIASDLYNILSLFIKNKNINNNIKTPNIPHNISNLKITRDLIKTALPLTSNRLLISILSSLESILIPTMLKRFGLSTSEALSIYGILTGMVLPFILFPSAITNSFAVMLLPSISESNSKGNKKSISNTASLSMKYSILLGIFSTAIFLFFGKSLGINVYHNETAGYFLRTLSFLCPFLYLTTTLGSILNGLSKAHLTFIHTIIGVSIRIFFVIFLIPKCGISGYLIGLLASQLTIAILDCLAIFRHIQIDFSAISFILKPLLILLPLSLLAKNLYTFCTYNFSINDFLLLVIICFLLLILYVIGLIIVKTISFKDLCSK